MATAVTAPDPRPSALRGYFETSLYLLLLVSVLSLISTGKLDLVSMLVTPAALLFKGYRWWRGHGPELTNRAATWLMTGYLAFFPVDLAWVSRGISPDAQNPGAFRGAPGSDSPDAVCHASCGFSARARRATACFWRCWPSAPCWPRPF